MDVITVIALITVVLEAGCIIFCIARISELKALLEWYRSRMQRIINADAVDDAINMLATASNMEPEELAKILERLQNEHQSRH